MIDGSDDAMRRLFFFLGVVGIMYNGDLEWFYRIIAQSSFRASSFATQRSTRTPHSCGHRPMVAEGPEKLPCCDSQPARDRMSADEADPISELLARLEADIRDMPVVEAVALHEAYDAGAVAAAAGRREVKRVADERMATVTVALVDELVEAESAEAETQMLAKKEREEAAIAMRKELAAKAQAAKKAEIARQKQIKKEMAEATKNAARIAAEKEKLRFERSQAERKEMIRHLTMDMKLRDEDEIANERREGSSMSKGGKDDFTDAAKKKGDMSGF